ncbi:hypothetical protein [Legionella maceachernii]|uniref:DNA mimic ocr n=1 Tax=Legionella maceachernii TaxID=466 RepID=A0A0W0WBS9_9GAMM|nr:hypothetical protein [Legionella maceachernii]KTD29694.1 DNA mimic ocr [Legionella maceachernii]SKA21238.1 DNA mimic ocr [Legionella maceachernii]SUP02558.1 DNA mimic ocr [Legionella maceachernii]
MSRSSKRELLNNLYSSIKERLEWHISNDELKDMTRDEVIDSLEDSRFEIIDGELPIYYSDMAKLLAENTNFATVDDEGILPKNPNVWDIITASVHEFLSGEFYQLACDAVDELIPEFSKEF